MSDTTPSTPVRLTDVDESELHRLLWDDQRRTVIDVLTDGDGPCDVSAVAAAVARREDETTVADVTVQLHHVHLPMLAEMGVVDYDPAASRVTPHPPLYSFPV